MFCMDFFLQTQASRPKPAGQREGPKNREDYFDTAGATGINRTPLQLRPFVIGSAFVGTNAHVEAKTWLFALGRVQGFPTKKSW